MADLPTKPVAPDDAGQPPRRRKPGGGRRRNPDIDARVLSAARDVYAQYGWASFRFDRVAKAAQVSRDVLYRRYSDCEALLIDAMADAELPTVGDDGPIYDRLMSYARDIYAYFTSASGVSSLRIHLEAKKFPELYASYRERVVDPNFAVNISALTEAARRGELRQTTDPEAVLEAIGGGVLIHSLFSQHSGATKGASPLKPDLLEATLRGFVTLALDESQDTSAH